MSKVVPRKLAYTQVICWGLWCVWIVIALLFVYAFLLGVTAPLTSQKRIYSSVYPVQFSESVVSARVTLQPPASCGKVSALGELLRPVYIERKSDTCSHTRNDVDVIHGFPFSTVRCLRYLHCLPFSQYIVLGILSVWNDPYAEVERNEKCTYCVEFLFLISPSTNISVV